MTISDKLLLAAYDMTGDGRKAFTAEDLVVAAWRKYPDAFGLAGFADSSGRLLYPDSNRVFAEIMGSKPIRKRGFLVKVGQKLYELTEAGRERARMLGSRDMEPDMKKAGLHRELQIALRRLMSSRALEKYRDGRKEEISFHDACAFWRISPRSVSIELEGRMNDLLSVIAAAEAASGDKTVAFEHDGSAFSPQELALLRELHSFLVRLFSKEIEIIRKRIDQRKRVDQPI